MRKTRKTRKSRKSRGKNQFFTLMLNAKKTNKPAFTYNGKRYKRTTTKNGLVFYKKA